MLGATGPAADGRSYCDGIRNIQMHGGRMLLRLCANLNVLPAVYAGLPDVHDSW